MRNKWISGILAAVLILGTTGCGQSASSETNTTSKNVENQENSEEKKVLRFG